MSVQLQKLTEDLNIIQTLADQPTITSSELKAKFDEASNKIKDYINNILIDGIEDWGDDLKSTLEGELQDALDELEALINGLTAEDVPYDNTTSGLSATDVQHAIDEIKTALTSVTNNVNANLNKKSVYGDFEVTTVVRSDALPPSAPTSRDYTLTVTALKEGYMPLGIVGYSYDRSGETDADLRRFQLTTRASGRAVVTYRLKLNNTQTTITHALYFDILWVKIR